MFGTMLKITMANMVKHCFHEYPDTVFMKDPWCGYPYPSPVHRTGCGAKVIVIQSHWILEMRINSLATVN